MKIFNEFTDNSSNLIKTENGHKYTVKNGLKHVLPPYVIITKIDNRGQVYKEAEKNILFN